MDHETDPIYRLAASTAGSIGNDFLAALVRDLHGVMPVRLAMVTQSLGDPPTRVRALYSWKDGVLGAPVEYDLEGTPCQLVYRGQTVIIPEELAVRFPKEQGIWNSYCGVPLRNRAQVVVGHFAVISDGIITHLQRVEGMVKIFGRRVEAELQRIADDEERDSLIQRLGQQHSAARQKSQFMSKVLGMVAHDLRNPLASVVSRTELIQALIVKLQGGSDQIRFDGKLSESTDAILRSASRMETMIHDLIDAARRETTEISLNVAEFPLSRAVASAIQLHEEYAGRKALRIEADLDEQLRISADEDRLIEAVGNLLSNAIKYSSRDALIRVSCRAVDGGDDVEIVVADEGQGMTEEDIASAFKVFRTLSARPTDGESSTGLGLAIVKTIAEAHGGSVRAESKGRDQGTIMTLRLPVSFDP